jgi:hypothetical protein
MYKKSIFLHGGKGLVKHRSHLYNRFNINKHHSRTKGLDNYLLSMIKGVSLHSKVNKMNKMGSGSYKKNYGGSGLKFIR